MKQIISATVAKYYDVEVEIDGDMSPAEKQSYILDATLTVEPEEEMHIISALDISKVGEPELSELLS
jgi:hypothetical protein